MKHETQIALESASRSIVDHFGITAQTIKAVEELGELISALAKNANHGGVVNAEHVIDEIADAMIVIHQMEKIWNIAGAVDDRIIFKLDRTLTYIRGRNAAKEVGAGIL